jgi:hypothetical protein
MNYIKYKTLPDGSMTRYSKLTEVPKQERDTAFEEVYDATWDRAYDCFHDRVFEDFCDKFDTGIVRNGESEVCFECVADRDFEQYLDSAMEERFQGFLARHIDTALEEYFGIETL